MWMKEIEQKFKKLGNLVVDACAGTVSAEKACMALPKRRTFIGCKVVPYCIAEVIAQLILIFAPQVLNKETDIDGDEQLSTSAKTYVQEVKAIEV